MTTTTIMDILMNIMNIRIGNTINLVF